MIARKCEGFEWTMGKMKVCCECMVGLLWEFEEFSRKAWVVDISVAECAYLFSREKMIGGSMLSHRRLHRLLKRLRAMPQERMVLVAFIIMNHTTCAHTRLIHEERIQ